MDSAPRFIDVAQLAELLSVSPRVARSLLARREIRAIQVGGRGIWRIDVAEVDAYIERQYADQEAGHHP